MISHLTHKVIGLWNQCVLISKDEYQQPRMKTISLVKFLSAILLTCHQSLVDSVFSIHTDFFLAFN